jgi:hypothetical protein
MAKPMKRIEHVETDVAQRLGRLPWSRWHWLRIATRIVPGILLCRSGDGYRRDC